ncbi:MAG TPA: response regulator transcription factor [Thermomicrobiaceae bacterium]|nr:response regulator transcription factor [Thermomicrobiaceae bacterium]
MGDAQHILVVEDERSIAAVLRRGLSYEGYRVTVAENGARALEVARDDRPDLVVLDIMLPGGIDGLEVCRRLRAAGDDFPILMLTARDEVADRVAGLDVGADDYMVKPFAFEELLARVRALLRRQARRGEDAGADGVLRFSDLTLDTTSRFAYRGERRIDLTTREYELLLLFMRHPNQVLTRDVIMERVWGYDFPGESNVLEVYISNLRRHLEGGGEARLLQTVRGAGYALRTPTH